MNNEEILKSVPGLEDHLWAQGVGRDYRLVTLSYDEECNAVGYALQSKTATLMFPCGMIVAGVYKDGKYAEKCFSTEPLVEAKILCPNEHRIYLSIATSRDEGFLNNLEFKLNEFKDATKK